MTAASAAVVSGSIVTNMVVVDIDGDRQTTYADPFGAEVVVLPDGSPVAIGWVRDGEGFAPPPAPPEPEASADAPADTTADTTPEAEVPTT